MPSVVAEIAKPVREAYSIREVAEILGMSYLTVYRGVQAGQIPAVTFGRNHRITRTTVDHLLKSGW